MRATIRRRYHVIADTLCGFSGRTDTPALSLPGRASTRRIRHIRPPAASAPLPAVLEAIRAGPRALRCLLGGASSLGDRDGLESVAAADRRDFEMERRVAWMPAIVDECLGSFLAHADAHES